MYETNIEINTILITTQYNNNRGYHIAGDLSKKGNTHLLAHWTELEFSNV